MRTPSTLKYAAYCLIAGGSFYVFVPALAFALSRRPPTPGAKIFFECLIGYGLLLWLAAFLLYRCNVIGKYIWYVCCPVLMIHVPIGTVLGVFVFINLNKHRSRAALEGGRRA